MRDRAADGDRRCRHRRRLGGVPPRRAGRRPTSSCLDRGPLFETGGSHVARARAWPSRRTGPARCAASRRIPSRSTRARRRRRAGAGTGSAASRSRRAEARMAELQRRRGWARSYGIEDTELLTPEQTAERIPLLDPSTILGAYLRALRRRSRRGPDRDRARAPRRARRASRSRAGSHVTGFDVARRARPRRAHRSRADRVRARAALRRHLGPDGRRVWPGSRSRCSPSSTSWCGPTRSRSSRASRREIRPSDPAAPGLRDVLPAARGPLRRGQLPPRADRDRAVRAPAPGGELHAVADAVHPARLRRRARPRRRGCSRRSPGRMRPADPARSLNGMFSFTPDAGSIVGESARVRGVWVCEAVWVTHAAGWAGRSPSGWRRASPATTWPRPTRTASTRSRRHRPYVLERGKQQYREVYDILHPLQQPARPRGLRLTPFHQRHVELGAEFFTGAGWERPQWFDANKLVLSGAAWESTQRAGPRRTGRRPSAPSTSRRANARRSST